MYAPGAGAGQAIFTDDVSLQVFMEALKRLVCGENNFTATKSLIFSAHRLSVLRLIDMCCIVFQAMIKLISGGDYLQLYIWFQI